MHQVRFALKIHFWLQIVTRDVDQNVRAKVPVIILYDDLYDYFIVKDNTFFPCPRLSTPSSH